MTDEKDEDKTPVEPLMERKKSSQRVMVAIGWKTCPDCQGVEGVHCDTCFDPDSRTYARRLPPDEYIKWIQKHSNADTDPAALKLDEDPDSDPIPPTDKNC